MLLWEETTPPYPFVYVGPGLVGNDWRRRQRLERVGARLTGEAGRVPLRGVRQRVRLRRGKVLWKEIESGWVGKIGNLFMTSRGPVILFPTEPFPPPSVPRPP